MTVMAAPETHPASWPRLENSGRCRTASTMAPTVPMAPASVGVARPMKIVPSTRKISTTEGTMPHRHFFTSGQPDSVRPSRGMPGTHWGFTMLTMNTYRLKSSTCTRLGPQAPAYMSPTERPSTSASTISTSDGGISCVIVPEAAITPVAKRWSYP